MVAELLSILIKNSEVEGINIMGQKMVTSQFADDKTLLLKTQNEIHTALNLITQFSKAAGLKLNLINVKSLHFITSQQTLFVILELKQK